MLVVVPAPGYSVSVVTSVTCLWEVELLALATLSISTGRPLLMVASTQYPPMMGLFATATLTREPLNSAMSTASQIMTSGLQAQVVHAPIASLVYSLMCVIARESNAS